MKTKLLPIITIGIIGISGFFIIPQAFAICVTGSDWPDRPCYGCFGCYPGVEQEKLDWAPYYDFKGSEWMESKKQEMMLAIQNGTLFEWIQLTQNQAHNNVHRYYFLLGQVPNYDGKFVDEVFAKEKVIPPPLKQFKAGIPANEIQCSKNLQLVQKYDGSPACVKPETKTKLIQRGWALDEAEPEPEEYGEQVIQEHYEIEIIGLKDKYLIGEQYSFSFIISGYGYSCAGYEVSYPDESGDTISMGAFPLCDPNPSLREFKINYLDIKGTLGNVGIKNPGTYAVTVTFDKPSKYFPTTVSKEFHVMEN